MAKIDELAAKIEEASRLRHQATQEAEASINSALHAQFTSERLRGALCLRLADIATIVRGHGPVYAEGSGKLVINQKCVRWARIDKTHAKEVSELWVRSLPEVYFFREDDVAVNSTGEGTIGRVCVVSRAAEGLPFDSHILSVRLDKQRASSRFIAYYLRSPDGQAAIENSKGAKTTKQTELGVNKLGDIVIPTPPLAEQQQIVEYLDDLASKMEDLRRVQAETATELDAIMPCILDKAFKGEL